MNAMRRRGVLLPVALSIFVAAVILVVLALSGRGDALAVQSVGNASEVGPTPLYGTVRAADGADDRSRRRCAEGERCFSFADVYPDRLGDEAECIERIVEETGEVAPRTQVTNRKSSSRVGDRGR